MKGIRSKSSVIVLVGFCFIVQNILFAQSKNATLFSIVSAEHSNVHFENSVVDSKKNNILIYESFYNGGGVAIGDINNDGLPDIYFSGNQADDKLYINKGNFVFEDISEKAGILNKGGWSSGVTMADVNNDGFLDIYVCKTLYDDFPKLRENELYINNQDGTFTESGAAWGVNNIWRSQQATFFDFDLDGDLDMFLVNQPPNPGFLSPLSGQDWLTTMFSCRLYENLGTHFKDISEQAGVLQKGYGLNASAADFNKDGLVDIYVTNDYDTPDFLYQNNGDGTFTNIINKSMRHISYFSMGSDVGDINNDGLIDLISVDMVAESNFRLKANMSGMNPQEFWNIVNAGGHYQYMFNTLQINNGINAKGDISFSEIGQLAGLSRTDWSWTPLMADFDNDGRKDIFITNGIKKDLRNNDSKKKSEEYLAKVTNEYVKNHPNQGQINIWDVIDYQELIDMLPAEKLSNYMFWNSGKYEFVQKQDEWGLGELSFSSGAAYADLDNDGDLDLIICNVDEKPFIYKNNTSENKNSNSLRIVLKDESRGKSIFGAKITIEYDGDMQFFETSNSRGFYSSSENIVHFGVGKVKNIDRVVVDWGKGFKSELKNVKSNNLITINRQHAVKSTIDNSTIVESIFTEVTDEVTINFSHKENRFNDFERESLLPHKMSMLGPGLDVADVNGDGLEDLFVGGAIGQAGKLFIQNKEGKFEEGNDLAFQSDILFEDMDACFVDVDNDGDKDLYVVSGGNEYPENSMYYQDRLYLNNGKGVFSKASELLPNLSISGSKVIANDFDGDGDLDLFVGGRQTPGKYPFPTSSFLLVNTNGKYENATSRLIPDLNSIGMVTDALWTDYDNDGDSDLFVVGEWMSIKVFKNENGKFIDQTKVLNLNNQTGWWFSIEQGDFDNDGDIDYIAGNLGHNYKYKASENEPFEVYAKDFDENGSVDIVLSYYEKGISYPLRGRQCSSEQMPFISDKFKEYNSFAASSLIDVYSASTLQKALNYKANTFSSVYIENLGNGNFSVNELPVEAQFSSINDFLVKDLNDDGNLDIVCVGNLFNAEIETPRNDAGTGLVLLGDGKGNFEAVFSYKSGLFARKEAKKIKVLKGKQGDIVLIANNNDKLEVFKIN